MHSSWITENILAMQRPTDELINGDAKLVDQFKKQGITALFNLTQPGEHPYCGQGLQASGFTYTPEKFMTQGIKHFNYSWKDMTTPTNFLMFDIVQIARAELEQGGKIAVHCHAGFGRTGLVVACILMLVNKLGCKEAIELVRRKRKGSIQTKKQEQFIYAFHDAVRSVRDEFRADKFSSSTKSDGNINSTIGQTVTNQQYFLSTDELDSKLYRYRNKVMVTLLKLAMDSLSFLSTKLFLCAALGVFDSTNFNSLYEAISSSESIKNISLVAAQENVRKYVTQLVSCREDISSVVKERKISFVESISSLQQDDSLGVQSIMYGAHDVDDTMKLKTIFNLVNNWFGARHDSIFSDSDVVCFKEILRDSPSDANIADCRNRLYEEVECRLSRYKLQLLADLIIVIRVLVYNVLREKSNDCQMEGSSANTDVRLILVEIILLRMGWLCCHHHKNKVNENDEKYDDWLKASDSLHNVGSLCLSWQHDFDNRCDETHGNDHSSGDQSLSSVITDVLRVFVGRINTDSEDKSSELIEAFIEGKSLSYAFPTYSSSSAFSSPITTSSKLNNKVMWSPEVQNTRDENEFEVEGVIIAATGVTATGDPVIKDNDDVVT